MPVTPKSPPRSAVPEKYAVYKNLENPPDLPAPKWSQNEILAGNSGLLHPLAIEGINAFNRRDYFEAHEDLEIAWREETQPIREVYRGILQVGLAYYHILHANYRGAVKMFQRSKPWLAPFPVSYRGIDIARLRNDASRAETELLLLGPNKISAFNPALMLPILFVPSINSEDM
jgi:uncharacterized protein